MQAEGKTDRMISLRRRRRMRRSGWKGQRRIDDLLSGLYNLGSCGKYGLQQLPHIHTCTHTACKMVACAPAYNVLGSIISQMLHPYRQI